VKLTYFASSTVLVEAGNRKILMDPWLEDGEYYGSWAHVPPVEVDYGRFEDVDYIYISHIHPDHLSRKTLERLPKHIPVLIHSYDSPFLKRNIEAAGFTARELPHNQRTDLGGATITILAADDCDPELCGAYFSCAPLHGRTGSTQIDSLCVVEHDGQVLVNTNDCPIGLTRGFLPRIREEFGAVDLLLTGYSGAGPFPQCFANLTAEEKRSAAAAKRRQFLEQGLGYIEALKPRFVLPFAGQYTLAGPLTPLNALRGVPELDEARAYFEERLGPDASKVVLLARGGSLDLADGTVTGTYEPMPAEEKKRYIDEVLAPRSFSFEADPEPDEEELVELARAAARRAEAKRVELGISSPTKIYVRLGAEMLAVVSLLGEEVRFTRAVPGDAAPRVTFSVDPRLLKRILSGPRFAHWNNATIGSHIEFDRSPNVYERGVSDVMNYFHA
jgi:UDP-MurNAc hydroxylase